MKYYIDTSIWMDILEDRKGFRGEPLSKYAYNLLNLILQKEETILISDVLLKELLGQYSPEEVTSMLNPFSHCIQKVITTKPEGMEIMKISKERGIPFGDAAHAVLARNYNALMVTRDKHFRKMWDICTSKKPEEIT